jgi:hypothetical protein
MPESSIPQRQATPPASGTELEIRPIEAGDKAALAAAVDQSSDEAVYRRIPAMERVPDTAMHSKTEYCLSAATGPKIGRTMQRQPGAVEARTRLKRGDVMERSLGALVSSRCSSAGSTAARDCG